MSYRIITDTSANLPTPLLRRYGVEAVPFTYLYDDTEHACTDTEAFDGAAYYNMMREGKNVTTAQINPFAYEQYMRPALESGEDVLFIGMSSGISGSYSMAEFTAETLSAEFPDRVIRTVDTLGASLGEGLLVLKAVKNREKGMDINANADMLLKLRQRMAQVFTVDDLMHLRRTGRLFNAAAKFGTMLQLKPLLKGNDEGRIVICGVARGFKKAVAQMAKRYSELVKDAGEQIVGIAHADCPDAASLLAQLLNRSECPPRDIMTVCYEPVTGSHVGPGTLALFFLGDESVRSEL